MNDRVGGDAPAYVRGLSRRGVPEPGEGLPERVVVVVGCQRSGTTLVGQILGAHPGAMLIDEKDGLYPWFPELVAGAPATAGDLATVLDRADSKYLPTTSRVQRSADGTPRLACGVTHLILKAPNLTFDFDLISRLRLPVSVVYPVRDVRAVVSSMGRLEKIPFVENQVRLLARNAPLAGELGVELDWLGDERVDSVEKRAKIWSIKSSLQSRFLRAGLSTLSFRYEELIADSAAMCARLAEHVSLELDELMSSHERVYRGVGPGGTERFRAIDGRSLSRWKESLGPSEEAAVMRVAAGTMADLGYRASA